MSPEMKGSSSPSSFAGGMLRIIEHFAGRVGAIVLGLTLPSPCLHGHEVPSFWAKV